MPLGFGDGLESVTPVDNRLMLACQTVHEHPLVGGFVARLSPRVLAAYRAGSPCWRAGCVCPAREGLKTFLSWMERQPRIGSGRTTSASSLVNRTTASSTLQQYVEHQLAVTKIAEAQRSRAVRHALNSSRLALTGFGLFGGLDSTAAKVTPHRGVESGSAEVIVAWALRRRLRWRRAPSCTNKAQLTRAGCIGTFAAEWTEFGA